LQSTPIASTSPTGASSSPAPATAHSAAVAQNEFVAVRGAPADSTSAELMLVLAYILMWTLLLGFVYFSFRRQRGLAERIEHVEQALDGAENDARKE
jgi:CcmD family protein